MGLKTAFLSFLLLQAVAAVPNGEAPHLARQDTPTAPSVTDASATSYTTPLTGQFTAGGGIYPITSESGYVIVAGHTLSPGGPNALVGGEIVTEASGGLILNGITVPVTPITSETSSATIAVVVTSDGTTSTSASVVAVASSSTSDGGAMPTGVPLAGAVLGGLMGVLML